MDKEAIEMIVLPASPLPIGKTYGTHNEFPIIINHRLVHYSLVPRFIQYAMGRSLGTRLVPYAVHDLHRIGTN